MTSHNLLIVTVTPKGRHRSECGRGLPLFCQTKGSPYGSLSLFHNAL